LSLTDYRIWQSGNWPVCFPRSPSSILSRASAASVALLHWVCEQENPEGKQGVAFCSA
jgi:hypothetical protein